MKKRKFKIGILFYNNKFVAAVSIILAFILWIKVSTSESEVVSKQIGNIPITVNLSDTAQENGLTVFGLNDIKAEVTVSGNRLILGQLSSSDIQVLAQQSSNIINAPGNYTLELIARKNSILTDYKFESSVSPSIITVMVDRMAHKTFDVQPNIQYSVHDDKYANVILSESTVDISGPESIVSQVNRVCIEGEIKGILDKTATINNLPIILYDSNGNKVNNPNLTFSVLNIDATVSVLSRKVLNIEPDFSGKPEGLILKSSQVKITPETVEIAAPDEVLSNVDQIFLEQLNFSKINPTHNKFDLALKIPSECKNLSNTTTASIMINMTGIASKSINTNKILFVKVPEGKNAVSSTVSLNIEVVGPSGKLKSLTSEDISLTVDLSGMQNFTGRTEVPATVVINQGESCWVYGDYKVNIAISNK